MAWVFGVDASFDEISEEEAERLYRAGVAVFAQCLWTGMQQPPPRVTNLRRMSKYPIALIGYISVSTRGPGDWHVNMARAGLPQDIWDRLVKVPVDVELPGLDYNTHIISALDMLAHMGKPKDIYTSYHAWVDLLGNPHRPYDTGLWNAYWDGKEDFDFPRLPYGGWKPEEVWGEQWSGGTYVEGVFVDRNIFRSEVLLPDTLGKAVKEVNPMDFEKWRQSVIVGFDGKPVQFEVLQGDLSTKKTSLTWGQYLALQALGLIVRRHSHVVKVSGEGTAE